MIKIPLFARYFGSQTKIRMADGWGKYDDVEIDYIYDAFKDRFLAELEAEGLKIVKVDTNQPGE